MVGRLFNNVLDQVVDIKALAIKILLVLVALLVLLSGGLALYAKTLRLERDLSRATVADLSRVIDGVNKKVREWQAAADLQARAAADSRIEAERIRVQGEKRVEAIRASRVPSACPEALQWGADQVLRTLGGSR